MFIQLAIILKLLTVAIFLVHVLGLLGDGKLSFKWIRFLYSSSFVCELVACSLQFYIWVIYLLRVRYYAGKINKISYFWRMAVFSFGFVLMGSLLPVVNLLIIFIEVFSPDLLQGAGQAIIIYFIASSVIQFICLLVTGSVLIQKLHEYFAHRYDKQRKSMIVGLLLILSALTVINLRYSLELSFLRNKIKLYDEYPMED